MCDRKLISAVTQRTKVIGSTNFSIKIFKKTKESSRNNNNNKATYEREKSLLLQHLGDGGGSGQVAEKRVHGED